MEEIRLTLRDAMETFNKRRSTIYNWMEEGRLRYIQLSKGRIIITTQEEINQIKENDGYFPPVKSSSPTLSINHPMEDSIVHSNIQPNIQYDPTKDSIVQELLDAKDQIIEIQNQALKYAELAGQTKLLTDNLHTKEKDSEFYKNEYFRLKYELENFKKLNEQDQKENQDQKEKISQLEKENQDLNQQLQQEQNKPFWKKKVL